MTSWSSVLKSEHKMTRNSSICLLLIFLFSQITYAKKIIVGAEREELYLPALQKKRVALVTNHTACVGKTHIVDKLRKKKITITKIFAPEHGFRGQAAPGAHQKDAIDEQTGIPLISLYGKKTKPTAEDLKDVDILIFDIQDVGARFYTYISTLQYVMEAAAEYKKPLIILDRPNPNGFYVDGPICEFFSFVGKQPIPLVHGMTIGEYAQMLNGQGWLSNSCTCNLAVIPCKNYTHTDLYRLPIAPSPNLQTMNAIYLYPSLCLFEGTPISVGRGTKHPFECLSHPQFPRTILLVDSTRNTRAKLNKQINIAWLKHIYEIYPDKEHFFKKFFTNLAGTTKLAEQIRTGMPEPEIRASWQPGLETFKKIRKKYLLYPDFE